MGDVLPDPNGVANLSSVDGSVTLTQVRGGRTVDLSVPTPTPPPVVLTVQTAEITSDFVVPAAVYTDLPGMAIPTADGDVWLVTVMVTVDPDATTTAMGVKMVSGGARSTFTGGAQGAEVDVTAGATDINVDVVTLTFTGLWTTAGGADTLKVQGTQTGGTDAEITQLGNIGLPVTGIVALKVA